MKPKIDPNYKHSTSVFDVRFNSGFLHPRYWSSWILIGLSYVLYLLPHQLVDVLGARLGDLLRVSNKKRPKIASKNVSLMPT